jgi:hypothetical protein
VAASPVGAESGDRIGAVEAGVGLWYFTNGHWHTGIFCVIAVGFLASVYVRRERKLKGPDGGRRY